MIGASGGHASRIADACYDADCLLPCRHAFPHAGFRAVRRAGWLCRLRPALTPSRNASPPVRVRALVGFGVRLLACGCSRWGGRRRPACRTDAASLGCARGRRLGDASASRGCRRVACAADPPRSGTGGGPCPARNGGIRRVGDRLGQLGEPRHRLRPLARRCPPRLDLLAEADARYQHAAIGQLSDQYCLYLNGVADPVGGEVAGVDAGRAHGLLIRPSPRGVSAGIEGGALRADGPATDSGLPC